MVYNLSINKIYILYRIITLFYKIELDIHLFKRYLYTMDKLHLNGIVRPYLWEDYIFIDDNMMQSFIVKNKVPFTNKDFDSISKYSLSILQTIIEQNKLIESNVYSINHLDYIMDDEYPYYIESRENHFLLREESYRQMLTEKNREININLIVN